ncbi:MAG: hypothetical protein HRU12_10460, partial [Phaeodactylibacter sp.]|nr:hypothetical protein [Phaeodactylibacter sp.]
GIVADGFLSFVQPSGEVFKTTFEATSYHTRNEVRYKKQRDLLGWDGAAVASCIACGLTLSGLYKSWFSVESQTLTGVIAIFLVFFTLLFASYLFFMGRWRRYRYIYAIEQFKRYHADEQWVALGEDVFANMTTDPYYLELKKQCISNGMGLLIVRMDKSILMQITPARKDVFGRKREQIDLVNQDDLQQMLDEGRYPEWMSMIKPEDLLRFQRRYKYQVLIIGACIAILSTVLYREVLALKTIEEESYDDYLERVAEVRIRNDRYTQPITFKLDTLITWPYPFRKDFKPYLSLSPSQPQAAAKQPPARGIQLREGFIGNLEAGAPFTYDCSRLRPLTGTGYIIQEGVYQSFSAVSARIRELEDYGFTASAVWLGCFDELEKGYALYFGFIFDDPGLARSGMDQLQQRLGDNVLNLALKLRSLTPLE